MPSRLALAGLLAAALLAACGGDDTPDISPLKPAVERGRAEHFSLERVRADLARPTYAGTAPGDPDALWVLEQAGRVVRIGPRGERRTVVDLRDEVRVGTEQGMLGLAFDPDFPRSRRLYLHYSERSRGDTRVASLDTRTGARRELLAVAQPEPNHNGGGLEIGPDGRLYLGLGDGGGAFDPDGNGQDLGTKLGKLLSLDVAARGAPKWRTELYGLRNPWRFWIDPATGEVWIGDVGQDEVEEVDRLLLEPEEAPKNLGWSTYEGATRIATGDHPLDERGELVWPVATYTHRDGCSITGGVVYRGKAIPRLSGRYVYGDFCSGALWSLKPLPGGRAADVRREAARVPQLTHIGTDADGELLFASAAGTVQRAVRVP